MELKHSVRHSMELNFYHYIQNILLFSSRTISICVCALDVEKCITWLPRIACVIHVTISFVIVNMMLLCTFSLHFLLKDSSTPLAEKI